MDATSQTRCNTGRIMLDADGVAIVVGGRGLGGIIVGTAGWGERLSAEQSQ